MAKRAPEHHFHVQLTPHEIAAIVAAILLIAVVAIVTYVSDQVSLVTLGLYLILIGAIMLGFGLAKTNDELLNLTNHYENLHRQELINHLTRDRFFVVFGVFLMATGILIQILGVQFFG